MKGLDDKCRARSQIAEMVLAIGIIGTLIVLALLLRIALSPHNVSFLSVIRPSFFEERNRPGFNRPSSFTGSSAGRAKTHSDIDLDGSDDLLVFDAERNPPTWYAYSMSGVDGPQRNATSSLGRVFSFEVGEPGSIPVEGDYNGDGLIDLATYRPGDRADWQRSQGIWSIYLSKLELGHIQPSGEIIVRKWGDATAVPVPGDYDGDGRIDLGVYYPVSSVWKILLASDDWNIARAEAKLDTAFLELAWGDSCGMPFAGDFDGDGRDDLAVYSTGSEGKEQKSVWRVYYMPKRSPGAPKQKPPRNLSFGNVVSIPLVGDFNCDRAMNIAAYDPADLKWSTLVNRQTAGLKWGLPDALPLTGDFDGDGCSDFAFYLPVLAGTQASLEQRMHWAILPSTLVTGMADSSRADMQEQEISSLDLSQGLVSRILWKPMGGKPSSILRYEFAQKVSGHCRKGE